MAEEKKNAAEVQEDTEKEISENETVTEAQDDSPEATAGENTAEESEAPRMKKLREKPKPLSLEKRKRIKKISRLKS